MVHRVVALMLLMLLISGASSGKPSKLPKACAGLQQLRKQLNSDAPVLKLTGQAMAQALDFTPPASRRCHELLLYTVQGGGCRPCLKLSSALGALAKGHKAAGRRKKGAAADVFFAQVTYQSVGGRQLFGARNVTGVPVLRWYNASANASEPGAELTFPSDDLGFGAPLLAEWLRNATQGEVNIVPGAPPPPPPQEEPSWTPTALLAAFMLYFCATSEWLWKWVVQKEFYMAIAGCIFLFISAGSHHVIIHGSPLLYFNGNKWAIYHWNRQSQFWLEGMIQAAFMALLAGIVIAMTFGVDVLLKNRTSPTKAAAGAADGDDAAPKPHELAAVLMMGASMALFYGLIKYAAIFAGRYPGYLRY